MSRYNRPTGRKERIPEEDNPVVVRVWLPRNKTTGEYTSTFDSFKNNGVSSGHAGIEIKGQYYAMSIPEGESPTSKTQVYLGHVSGEVIRSYADDPAFRKRKVGPDVVATIYSLKTSAMLERIDNQIRKGVTNKWSLLGKNIFNIFNNGAGQSCSGLVYDLLKRGGIFRLARDQTSQRYLVTSPISVAMLAIAAYNYEQQAFGSLIESFTPPFDPATEEPVQFYVASEAREILECENPFLWECVAGEELVSNTYEEGKAAKFRVSKISPADEVEFRDGFQGECVELGRKESATKSLYQGALSIQLTYNPERYNTVKYQKMINRVPYIANTSGKNKFNYKYVASAAMHNVKIKIVFEDGESVNYKVPNSSEMLSVSVYGNSLLMQHRYGETKRVELRADPRHKKNRFVNTFSNQNVKYTFTLRNLENPASIVHEFNVAEHVQIMFWRDGLLKMNQPDAEEHEYLQFVG